MKNLGKLVSALALLGLGCTSGTETGNPSSTGTVSLGLTAFSSTPETVALETGQGGLSIDRVALHVGSLTLLPCSAEAEALTIVPGEYDLTQATATETMGSQQLCGVRLELSPAPTAGQDLPAGMAVYLHGLRSDGSEFDVESSAPRTLELHAPTGTSFGTEPLLLGFDVGTWFEGVDVHGAHAGADGIARLDMTLNPALLSQLETQTLASLRLYVDANADGVLDDSERTPVASP